eukprot:6021748-Lingulodinium_polyedra.AAC.1
MESLYTYKPEASSREDPRWEDIVQDGVYTFMWNRAGRDHKARREAAAIVRRVKATAREASGFAPRGSATNSGQGEATAAAAQDARASPGGAPASSSGLQRGAATAAG